ncbi:MAG TPA: hypothetical protein VFP32_01470 [Candidatus Saccharimonadales bacterium]|nr:hypothetical protein [Candidatus Saccharimonadales bacterium]
MARSEAVQLTIQPAEHWNFGKEFKIPYQKIVSLRVGKEEIFPQEVDDGPVSEREIVLPQSSTARLILAATEMQNSRRFNCHRFARTMAGEHDIFGYYETLAPMSDDFCNRPRVGNLPAGAIGMVGAAGFGVMHSLVGLGENIPESIQVMSGQGEFGIAKNEDVLDWYRSICEDDEIYLRRY